MRMASISKQEALTLLRRALANPLATFRDGQWEAIEALVQQRSRLLVVQRTGWGKSLVYFLTTRLLRDAGAGPTLLISPLLALMRNQMIAADRLGVRALSVNSANIADWARIRSRLLADQVDVLLVSPERLANEQFREEWLLPVANRVGLFVVDEAHCISDWGHDFRPDYQRITRVLQALPASIPVLATTATANSRVVVDVCRQLAPGLQVLRGSLMRPSLQLQNIHLPSQASRMAWLAQHVPALPGSGIIYALTIRDARSLAAWLQAKDIRAYAYWGGLESSQRELLEARLLNNEVKALVATSALGMGFDKPDMGFVIHYQRPGSVVHYYQQVGRAGRAINDAYGILLCGNEDDDITDYFIRSAFPPEAHVADVLAALNEADDGLTLADLEQRINLSRGQIDKVLKSLVVKSPAPVSSRQSRWYANPVTYVADQEKTKQLTEIRYAEQARMIEYMHSRSCLMQFLAHQLDDPMPMPCGRCSACLGSPLLPEEYSARLAGEARLFLRHSEQDIEPRQRWPAGALAHRGWSGAIADSQAAQRGRMLCRWGDDGWGELVRVGKQDVGGFSDELVAAAASLIRERWQPTPFPRWVTCVPSLTHPALVPDFAQRLANALTLPFLPVVRKVRPTEPQKRMQNSYQQAHNLVDAFSLRSGGIPHEPVLLVDDIVDSRWTLTVIAALLLQAGSGPVFPFALASASQDGGS